MSFPGSLQLNNDSYFNLIDPLLGQCPSACSPTPCSSRVQIPRHILKRFREKTLKNYLCIDDCIGSSWLPKCQTTFLCSMHSSEGLFIPSLPSNLHHFLPYPHSQIMTFLLFHSENGSNWKIIYITPHKPYLSIYLHLCPYMSYNNK